MDEIFRQVYSPVGDSILLSALIAALPPVLLAVLLAVLRIAPWRAAIAASAAAFLLAWLVWGMPFTLTLAAPAIADFHGAKRHHASISARITGGSDATMADSRMLPATGL